MYHCSAYVDLNSAIYIAVHLHCCCTTHDQQALSCQGFEALQIASVKGRWSMTVYTSHHPLPRPVFEQLAHNTRDYFLLLPGVLTQSHA